MKLMNIYVYFQIPIQALRAVNELVKAIAAIRARLSSANRDIVDV